MSLSILCVTDTLVAVGGLVCCVQGEDDLLVDTPGLRCIALPSLEPFSNSITRSCIIFLINALNAVGKFEALIHPEIQI